MKNKIVWGFLLVILGIVMLLNALGIGVRFLMFEGWWTLLIIIPCAIALFNKPKNWIWPYIGLVVGSILLLEERHLFHGVFTSRLVVAVAVIIAGVLFLIKSDMFSGGKHKK